MPTPEGAWSDPDAWKQQRSQKIPLGRVGAPLDIARAAVFLASDDSAFLTANVQFVDGGLTAVLL